MSSSSPTKRKQGPESQIPTAKEPKVEEAEEEIDDDKSEQIRQAIEDLIEQTTDVYDLTSLQEIIKRRLDMLEKDRIYQRVKKDGDIIITPHDLELVKDPHVSRVPINIPAIYHLYGIKNCSTPEFSEVDALRMKWLPLLGIDVDDDDWKDARYYEFNREVVGGDSPIYMQVLMPGFMYFRKVDPFTCDAHDLPYLVGLNLEEIDPFGRYTEEGDGDAVMVHFPREFSICTCGYTGLSSRYEIRTDASTGVQSIWVLDDPDAVDLANPQNWVEDTQNSLVWVVVPH